MVYCEEHVTTGSAPFVVMPGIAKSGKKIINYSNGGAEPPEIFKMLRREMIPPEPHPRHARYKNMH